MDTVPTAPSPPRRHPKRALDAPGQTDYGILWRQPVNMQVGDEPIQPIVILHSTEYHVVDSARANANRLGLSEEAVESIASYISTLMMPRTHEAVRTGILPTHRSIQEDEASSERPHDVHNLEPPAKRKRHNVAGSQEFALGAEADEQVAHVTVRKVDVELKKAQVDDDADAMETDT